VVVLRLVRGNLRKIIRRPATWITLLLLVGLVGLVYLAIILAGQQATDPQATLASRLFVTFPGAYTTTMSLILGVGGLLAVAFGGAIAGSEWSWGTLKAAVARGESRAWYTIAGYLGTAIAVIVGLLLAYLIGILLSILGASVQKVALDGLAYDGVVGDLGNLFGRASLSLAMNAALGFAIATIARSQLAGIAVGIGVYFLESVARLFLPDVIKWFPFAAGSAVVREDPGLSGGQVIASLSPDTAVFVVLAWLVVSLGVAALWTERAEIAG
jgi:hypothetical protein